MAEGKTVAELHKDMGELESNWKKLFSSLKGATAPRKILGEQDRSLTLVRDLLSSDFTQIVVNNSALGEEIKEYLKRLSPGKEKIVKLHQGKIQFSMLTKLIRKLRMHLAAKCNVLMVDI